MRREPSTFQFTHQILASHAGASVFCVADAGIGRTYRLYDSRPGPERNARIARRADARARDEQREKNLDLPSGASHVIEPVETSPLIMVRVQGPLEQRAGYHEPCAGWSDGHDAVCERLCAAFVEGDVLLVVDSPGGAAAGIEQNVTRALAAKAKYGRRVTVYADEMIGSAGVWWAFALGDEIYGPPQCEIGSIGARGGHVSIAGALEKEGVVVTYFADPPEKVALAPELPLSDVGAKRGMRDVKIMADAFRAAVCASPIGVRNGLTAEYLIELGADMLIGAAAVEAGLADGIETLESVTEYALALAESGERPEAPKAGAKRAQKERAMARTAAGAPPGVRAEGDGKPDDGDDDDDPESERGSEIPTKCGSCGVENQRDAKFCKGCGESMATKPMTEEASTDDPPPSSKPMGAARATAPARMSQDASLASILGASSDSPLAIKTAAIAMRQIRDTAVGITGKSDAHEIVGSLLTVPDRLARADRAAEAEAKRAAETAKQERWSLAGRLNKLGLDAWPRSMIFTDEVNDAGERKAVGYADKSFSPISTMPLGQLRGMVESFEKSAAKKPRDPFVPDRSASRDRAAEAPTNALPQSFTADQKKRLENHPDVRMLRNRGTALTNEQLVTALVATNPQSAAQFLAQNGASS